MTSSSVILPGAGMSPRRLQKLEVTPGSDGGAVRVFRIYRWWTMPVRCGCVRVRRVGFGPRPRGNTDAMSRAVRAVAAADRYQLSPW